MVVGVPRAVQEAFKHVQESHAGSLQLKRNRGNHHVHLITSDWDKDAKKPRKKTEHLGTITQDGVYWPKGTPRKAAGPQTLEIEPLHFGVLATQLMDGTLTPHDVFDLLDRIGKTPVPVTELEAVGVRFDFQKKRLRLYLYPNKSKSCHPKRAPDAKNRGASRKRKPGSD